MERVPVGTFSFASIAKIPLFGMVHCHSCLGRFLVGVGSKAGSLLPKGLLQFLHLQREVQVFCCW